MSDPTYQPKIYRENGGDTLHVAAGGSIVIDPGAIIGAQPTIADIATPTAATATDCATALNAVLDALRAAGLIL
jgi:hypothetical protein